MISYASAAAKLPVKNRGIYQNFILSCLSKGYGKYLWIMQGMFRANGGCGYVKKPDLLLDGNKIFNPGELQPVKKTLKVCFHICTVPPCSIPTQCEGALTLLTHLFAGKSRLHCTWGTVGIWISATPISISIPRPTSSPE